MIRGAISHTTASGLSIAYQVIGEGDRKLVWVPSLISHLELNWDFPSIAFNGIPDACTFLFQSSEGRRTPTEATYRYDLITPGGIIGPWNFNMRTATISSSDSSVSRDS